MPDSYAEQRDRPAVQVPGLAYRAGSFLPDLLAREAAERTSRRIANAESRQLLRDACRPDQLLMLERGYIIAIGCTTEHVYYLSSQLIIGVDHHGRTTGYCLHPRVEACDVFESLLALKLLIETNERRFLRLVEKLIKAPTVQPDGATTANDRGSPQGSILSPVLANSYT